MEDVEGNHGENDHGTVESDCDRHQLTVEERLRTRLTEVTLDGDDFAIPAVSQFDGTVDTT